MKILSEKCGLSEEEVRERYEGEFDLLYLNLNDSQSFIITIM